MERERTAAVLGRAAAAVLAAWALGGCGYLGFFKPADRPRAPGSWTTERGPAFAAPVAHSAVNAHDDWPAYNRSLSGERYSPLDQITTANVGRLGRVCTYDLGERTNLQTAPVVVGGVMYVTTALQTIAIDAATCAMRWTHTYRFSPGPPFDPNKTNRGVAYLDTPDGPRLFRGANDGRVLALDARTGRQLWNVIAGDPLRGEIFPAAPVVWRDLVIIGNAGGDDFGVTGRMMAFDVRTGGRVWTFDLVPRFGEAAKSWPPETADMPRGGATTWTTYTLDTLTGTLFIPTGNPAPDFLHEVRPGANLFTTSVVALDAATGAFKAHYPILERDFHDWDVAAAPVIVTTAAGRAVVVVAGKDGHIYGHDRKTTDRIFRTPVTTIDNIEAPLARAGTHFCPGVNGGTEWNGPAFSPQTNAFYVNSVDWCTTLKLGSVDELRNVSGMPWTGSAARFEPFGANDPTRRGWLTAIDAEDGHVRWKYASPTPLIAGVTTTAGGLVFSGDLNGMFFALDAATGATLFRTETGRPIGGGVVTYVVGGRQYVAVAAGLHSPVGWKIKSGTARIVVYAVPRP